VFYEPLAEGDGEASELTPASSLPVSCWSYRLPYSNSPRTAGRVTKTVWPGWMSPLSHDVLSAQLRQVAVWVARVSFSKATLAPGPTERTLGENVGEAAEPVILIVASAPVCGSTMNRAENAIAAGKSE